MENEFDYGTRKREFDYSEKVTHLMKYHKINKNLASYALDRFNENYKETANFFRSGYDVDSGIGLETQLAMYSDLIKKQEFDKSEVDYMISLPEYSNEDDISDIFNEEQKEHTKCTKDLYDPKLSEEYRNCPECSSHYYEHLVENILDSEEN